MSRQAGSCETTLLMGAAIGHADSFSRGWYMSKLLPLLLQLAAAAECSQYVCKEAESYLHNANGSYHDAAPYGVFQLWFFLACSFAAGCCTGPSMQYHIGPCGLVLAHHNNSCSL